MTFAGLAPLPLSPVNGGGARGGRSAAAPVPAVGKLGLLLPDRITLLVAGTTLLSAQTANEARRHLRSLSPPELLARRAIPAVPAVAAVACC